MSDQEREPSPENVHVTRGTLSAQELLEEIKPNGIPDPRFDINGDFAYPPLQSRFLESGKASYPVVKWNGRIVGIAEVLHDLTIPNSAELRSVSVQKDLKGQKISKDVLRAIFEFVAPRSSRLYVGVATAEGAQRLVHQGDGLSREYGVEVYAPKRKF